MVQRLNYYDTTLWLQEAINFQNEPKYKALFHELIPSLMPSDFLLLQLRKTDDIADFQNIAIIERIFFLFLLSKEIGTAGVLSIEINSKLLSLKEDFKQRVNALPGKEVYRKYWLNQIETIGNPEDVQLLRRFSTHLQLFHYILQLEEDSKLADKKRPPEIVRYLHGCNISIDLVQDYIKELELAVEEGEVGEENSSFITLSEQPTLIHMQGRYLTEGVYGKILENEGTVFKI